jgi:outer membrane protein OmpA-like peptidoglycan-associated protein
MSINLVEAVKSLFTPELINKAGNYLGENESGVSKAISGIIPAIFTGLINKVSTHEGANTVAQMAQEQNHSGIQDNVSTLFGNDGGGIMNNASKFIHNLFGNKTDTITSLISEFSGLKGASASSLFAMVSPLILSFLGKHAAANNLNAGGLAAVVTDQQPHVEAATPEGLELQSIIGTPATTDHPHHTEADTAFIESSSMSSGIRWLFPVLLFVLLAAAALYFYKGCNNTTPNNEHATTTEVTDTITATKAVTTASAGSVDSLGNYVYNLGNMVSIDLPNGAGKLEVGENSTEAKLVHFLMDKNAMIDSAKGNWFEFTNVRFNTGSSNITEESMVQLRNMVLIAKAFPAARFKIGGYTDNTGNEDTNMRLSKTRAGVVAEKIKSLGASSSVVGSDGYGSQFPIGDNATTEGKAQNRRVSVNVKAK